MLSAAYVDRRNTSGEEKFHGREGVSHDEIMSIPLRTLRAYVSAATKPTQILSMTRRNPARTRANF